MIKAGIIGCGTIADAHAEQIQRIPGCEIIGVCDSEELMARQMAERFGIKYYFTEPMKLIETTKPNIVHITTPPQSHFTLGRLCLESGCHVYVEKPFTLNAEEAEELITVANDKHLKVTTGHNLQFSHAAMRMRKLINKGYLGGVPVHMESIYGYDFEDVRYAKALLGDEAHWVRRLPGKLLHNIINHGICKIAEFLKSDNPTIIANGFTSPLLKGIDETDIIDELRVIIYDNENTTAYFTFSSQMIPKRRQFRIYGPQNALYLDDDHQTLIKDKGAKYKSYLNQFVPPFIFARQYVANSMYNIKKFIKKDFHVNSGMKLLIESFYRSVLDDMPPPISYREIILTTKIMDAIFEQIYPNKHGNAK